MARVRPMGMRLGNRRGQRTLKADGPLTFRGGVVVGTQRRFASETGGDDVDAGFGILGFGLFLLSIAQLYARAGQPHAWALFVLSLVAMGYAFSESHSRRWVALGLSAATAVVAILAMVGGLPVWSWGLMLLFTAGFGLLWAELRYPGFFERDERQERVPAHHGRVRRDLRGTLSQRDEEQRHRM